MSLTNNDSDKLTETPKSNKKTPGIVGLRNLGNTCFMNAGLQCLLNSPSIIKFFLENYNYDSNKEQVTLIGSFAGLVLRCWSGKFSVISPVKFKASLGNHKSEFKNNRQHDCQEFLTVLLDSLHEELNSYSFNTIPASPQVSTAPNGANSGESVGNGDCLPNTSVEMQLSNAKSTTFLNNNIISKENNHNLVQLNNPNNICTEHNCTNNAKFMENSEIPLEMQDKISSTQENENKDAKTNEDQEEGLTHNTIERPPFTDDYFTKDTKTRNTNVAVEAEEVQLNTDSSKFLKSNTKRNEVTNNNHITVDANELNKVFKDSLAKSNNDAAEEMPFKKCDINEYPLKNNDFCDLNCKNINSNTLNYNSDTKLVDKLCDKGLCNDEENAYKGSKRIKIDNNFTKNVKVLNLQLPSPLCEEDSPQSSEPSSSPPMSLHSGDDGNDEETLQREGMEAWLNYTSRNKNIIVDNLQGLFRSTIVCSECNHLSATFEPFMYLSLPIPRAFDQQIVIHYVPWRHVGDAAFKSHQDQSQNQHVLMKFSITVDKRKDVKCIIRQLTELIEENDCDSSDNNLNNTDIKIKINKTNCGKVTKTYNNKINKNVKNDNDCYNNSASPMNSNQDTTVNDAMFQDRIIIAEVLNNRISRVLEETMSIRLINQASRQLFAFSLPPTSTLSFPQVISTSTSSHATSLLIPQLPPEQHETIIEEHPEPGLHSSQDSSVSNTTVIPTVLHEKVTDPLVLPQVEQISYTNTFFKKNIEQCPTPPSFITFEASDENCNNYIVNVEVTKSLVDPTNLPKISDGSKDRSSFNEDENQKLTPVKNNIEYNQHTTQLENTDPRDKTLFVINGISVSQLATPVNSVKRTFSSNLQSLDVTPDDPSISHLLDQLRMIFKNSQNYYWSRVDSFGCVQSLDITEPMIEPFLLQLPDDVFDDAEDKTALNNTKLATSFSPRANLDASPHIIRMYNNFDNNDKKNNNIKYDENSNDDGSKDNDTNDNENSISDDCNKISSLSSICNSSEQLDIDNTPGEDRMKQTTDWLYCPTNNMDENNNPLDGVESPCESQNEFENYNENKTTIKEDKSTYKNINMTINNNLCTANNENAWKTCAICLDEMQDTQLRVHLSCNGLICSICLEKLFEAYEYRFNCQVCQMKVSGIDDFVMLDQSSYHEHTIKTLVMKVSFRAKLDDNFKYFSLPRVLYLPSQVDVTSLYAYVRQVVPFPHLPFSLHVVDSQGLRCSRCPFVKNCSGCKISKDISSLQSTFNQNKPNVHTSTPMFPTSSSPNTIDSLDPQNTSNHPSLRFTFSELNVQQNQTETHVDTPLPQDRVSQSANHLYPSSHKAISDFVFLPCDNLVVSYGELSHTKLQFKQIDHKSMQQNMNEPISLMECFENFSKSESLDSTNSWHCSRCDRKKQAHQCISIEKFPNTLIIHLKRFVFQGGVVTKINSQVDFPLVDFRPKPHVVYDLQGFICHSGGVDAGHYIAYSKHLKTHEWFRFNDEFSQRQEPSKNDQAYVLFYQLKDSCDVNFEIPQNLTFIEEDQKTNQGSDLLNCLDLSIHNCTPSRNNQVNNSLTRHNSLTNIK